MAQKMCQVKTDIKQNFMPTTLPVHLNDSLHIPCDARPGPPLTMAYTSRGMVFSCAMFLWCDKMSTTDWVETNVFIPPLPCI